MVLIQESGSVHTSGAKKQYTKNKIGHTGIQSTRNLLVKGYKLSKIHSFGFQDAKIRCVVKWPEKECHVVTVCVLKMLGDGVMVA